jgi:hypothetical protein
MKVFLSWSGARSHAVAREFEDWLPLVIQAVDPWISSKHIAKGATWLDEITRAINASNGIGIFFLTPDALKSSWLLFEAGGVAALEHKRVCTVLVGMNHSELQQNPLSHFQWTTLEKDDILKLVKDINSRLQTPLDLAKLERTFNAHWSDFDLKLKAALNVDATKGKAPEEVKATGPDVAALAKGIQGIEARMGRLEEVVQNLGHQLQSFAYRAPPVLASNLLVGRPAGSALFDPLEGTSSTPLSLATAAGIASRGLIDLGPDNATLTGTESLLTAARKPSKK